LEQSPILDEKHQTHKTLAADTTGSRRISNYGKGRGMHPSHLRIYYGPQEDRSALKVAQAEETSQRVSVSLGEILPLLADAVQSRRTWLRDFEDEEISISMDLYEVLLAYQHYRRPSA
jgi:hypothetical protein